jgi:hypothetical protein
MLKFNSTLERKLRSQEHHREQKLVGFTGDLTDVDALYSPPTEPIEFDSLRVSTDSGAHSIYKEHFVVGDKITAHARINADYSYAKSKEFDQFLESYIAHLHQHKDTYVFYVTLDIINNPELSWEITERMEAAGLNPMPVFHNGEDIKWLHRMVEKYDYIGISGLGQDITKSKFRPFGDACFQVICGSDGRPKVKVHGFALGTPEIIKMYPWYSADQSTWTYMSRVGSLLVPKPIHQHLELIDYDYLALYKVIPVTPRRDMEPYYIDNLTPMSRHFVQVYLDANDILLEEVRNSYHCRDVANIRLFNNIQNAAKKWYKERYDFEEGGNIYFAGTPAGAGSNRSRLIKLLHDVKIKQMNWLTTPVYQRHADNVREIVEAWDEDIDLRTLWDEKESSRARKKITMEVKPKIQRKPLLLKKPPQKEILRVESKISYAINTHRSGTSDTDYKTITTDEVIRLEIESLKKHFEDMCAWFGEPENDCQIQCHAVKELITEEVTVVVTPPSSKKSEAFFF